MSLVSRCSTTTTSSRDSFVGQRFKVGIDEFGGTSRVGDSGGEWYVEHD